MEWFNPRSTRQAIDLGGGRTVLVIDDALLDPEGLVAWASERAALFQPVDFSKYPGVWHEAPEGLPAALEDVFQQRARRMFDARRCLAALRSVHALSAACCKKTPHRPGNGFAHRFTGTTRSIIKPPVTNRRPAASERTNCGRVPS